VGEALLHLIGGSGKELDSMMLSGFFRVSRILRAQLYYSKKHSFEESAVNAD
jgi:hypothetical protein